MPSIAERLAALNQASAYKGNNEDKASVARAKPMNDRLATLGVNPGQAGAVNSPKNGVSGKAAFACQVQKQGTGIMSSRFMPRWCEVYASPPVLRFYTDTSATQFKSDFTCADRDRSPASCAGGHLPLSLTGT
eukprot:1953275-Prymnesium_polylepis.1